MKNLRIRLEGAWERLEASLHDLEHLGRLAQRDWLAERATLTSVLDQLDKALEHREKLRGKAPELDAVIDQTDEAVRAVGRDVTEVLGSTVSTWPELAAAMRAALDDEVLFEAPASGWRAALRPGRFVLTRKRLWWHPKRQAPRSWTTELVDARYIPELGRVSLADQQHLHALAELHRTALFRDVPLRPADPSRVLREASRPAKGRGGDVVLMNDAIVFLPQTRGPWALATGRDSGWVSPVEVTVLVNELLKLPEAVGDAAIWRAAQADDALVLPAAAVAQHHWVQDGMAHFGPTSDGVMVTLSVDEAAALGAWLTGHGVEAVPRVQYLRAANAQLNESPAYSQLEMRKRYALDGERTRERQVKLEAEDAARRKRQAARNDGIRAASRSDRSAQKRTSAAVQAHRALQADIESLERQIAELQKRLGEKCRERDRLAHG